MDIGSIETLGVFHGFPALFSKRFSPILRGRRSETPLALNVLWISSNDIWANITEIQKQTNNQDYSFPYCFLKLMAIKAIDASDNLNFLARNLYRMGIPGKVDATNSSYIMHKFITADFEVEVTFVTDDYDEVKKFINKWNFVSVEKRLNTNWVYDGISLSVRVELDGNISIPEKDNSVDAINYYEVKANLVIRGFMSESDPDFEPERISVIKQLNIRYSLYDPAFETLADQVDSIQAGLTEPEYVTIPGTNRIEEIVVLIDDEGNATLQENIP